MATLNKAAFEALYGTSGTTFPDNTTGEISEGDMRQFGKDIADSLYNRSVSGALTFATYEIGDWNMDADEVKIVTVPGPSTTTLRSISVIIRNDTGGLLVDLTSPYNAEAGSAGSAPAGAIWSYDGVDLYLSRVASGAFDNTFFDSTSYNRGWITIGYVS